MPVLLLPMAASAMRVVTVASLPGRGAGRFHLQPVVARLRARVAYHRFGQRDLEGPRLVSNDNIRLGRPRDLRSRDPQETRRVVGEQPGFVRIYRVGVFGDDDIGQRQVAHAARQNAVAAVAFDAHS
jgi:hypothetical protein